GRAAGRRGGAGSGRNRHGDESGVGGEHVGQGGAGEVRPVVGDCERVRDVATRAGGAGGDGARDGQVVLDFIGADVFDGRHGGECAREAALVGVGDIDAAAGVDGRAAGEGQAVERGAPVGLKRAQLGVHADQVVGALDLHSGDRVFDRHDVVV